MALNPLESNSSPSPAQIAETMRIAGIVCRVFGRDRLVIRNEFSLHQELATRFADRGVTFLREVSKGPKKRPDFMVGRIAVEIKIGGSAMGTLRQLKRYADDATIDGVVLVTTRVMRIPIPGTLGGKPVGVVNLWMNSL